MLDPTQAGVLEVIAEANSPLPPHVVARLDLYQMLSFEAKGKETPMLRSLERIIGTIETILTRNVRNGKNSRITGISFAGWHNLMSTALLNALAMYVGKLGLNSYLEIVPPHFLDEIQRPDLSLFAGVIVRNGTILANGEVRDYFQMEKMRSTVREFVSQSCLRSFTVMMLDMVDDRIEVSHAVVKRSYQWCGYHGALIWIGSEAALAHTEANIPVAEPLAAFQWLKEQKVMKVHEAYRSNRLVRRNQS